MAIAKLDTQGRWGIGEAGASSISHAIYIPQGFKVTGDNLASEDSGRTEDGIMHITWIRTEIKKATMTFRVISGNEVAYLKGLMQGKIYEFFYFDCGQVQHYTAYTGNYDYEAYNHAIRASEGGIYQNFTIDAVEM